ncbi:hypothetical protein NQZ68_022205 [Dissostichus eleginoides]|nr:hypothetical protein NQZ68_022205 [Dissostichus eleginoides]
MAKHGDEAFEILCVCRSLHSITLVGFALREVINVRLGILSQTLELRMGGGGAACRDTPAALHCS